MQKRERAACALNPPGAPPTRGAGRASARRPARLTGRRDIPDPESEAARPRAGARPCMAGGAATWGALVPFPTTGLVPVPPNAHGGAAPKGARRPAAPAGGGAAGPLWKRPLLRGPRSAIYAGEVLSESLSAHGPPTPHLPPRARSTSGC